MFTYIGDKTLYIQISHLLAFKVICALVLYKMDFQIENMTQFQE